MMGRFAHLLIAAIFVGTIPTGSVGASDSGLPPAPYKPIPVGTVLDYGSWKCEVIESRGMETVCADGDKRAAFYGRFVLHGVLNSVDYAGAVSELSCESYTTAIVSHKNVSFDTLELGEKDKRSIEGFWPLKVGNKARFSLRHGSGAYDVIDVELRVTGVTTTSLQGSERRVFEILENRQFRTCLATSGATDQNYQQAMLYDPASGVILKSERVWTGDSSQLGLKEAHTLVKMRHAEISAPYKPIPVGTVLDYGSWKCRIAESKGMETVCADGDKRAAFYGKFILHGAMDSGDYAGAVSELACDPPSGTAAPGYLISVDALELREEDKRKIEGFWPLQVGKTTKIALRHGSPKNDVIDVELRVAAITTISLSGSDRRVFEVVETRDFQTCLGRSSAIAKMYEQKMWYDPAAGMVLKSERIWTSESSNSGVVEANTLVRIDQIKTSKAVQFAAAKPAAGPDQAIIDLMFWGSIKNSTDHADFKAYLRKFPGGHFADLARNRLAPKPTQKGGVQTASLALAGLNFGNYHALVIGNNAYRNMPILKTAIQDAKAVARRLTDDYGFDAKLLIDATRADVINALARYRATLTDRDNLLVYYAGHGVIDDITRQGYWLPVDARKDTPGNWVSVHDVTLMLHAMQAKHVMVVSDSCYSGTLIRSAQAKLKTTTLRGAWVKRMLGKRARTALTSGGLEPVLDDGGGGHSVFANAFLAALGDNDGVLEGQRLFDAVKRPVVLNSNQTPQYSDIRLAGHEGGDFLFVKRRR